jgi:hypothetical protein
MTSRIPENSSTWLVDWSSITIMSNTMRRRGRRAQGPARRTGGRARTGRRRVADSLQGFTASVCSRPMVVASLANVSLRLDAASRAVWAPGVAVRQPGRPAAIGGRKDDFGRPGTNIGPTRDQILSSPARSPLASAKLGEAARDD